ncbi:MAG: hypothetical protein DRO67_00050 [Candidatus Asgardarchaeum californiense]|nr:MAG: hypothetical protein DRO67_00050 [Candidatus Asgardarchaeum californiense]
MKTEIHYKDKCGACNDRKALIDMLHWYGRFKQFKLLVKGIKSGWSFKQLAFYAGFSGVEGYPVHAMWRRYSNEV